EINLNTTWTDKTYMRRVLSNDAYAAAGSPAPPAQAWRVRQNGDFFSVVNFVEQADKDFLRRNGLDPDGALYKVNNSFTPGGSIEKKTRRDEPGTAAYDSCVNTVNNTPLGTTLTNYLLDTLDVPEILSYMSAVVITHQNDHPHKNYFLYRDTEGNGEWQMFPQDTDLSFGKNYIGDMGGVLSDVMYAANDQIPGRGTDVK